MQYNTIEELEAYFNEEIKRVSNKEISEIEAEIEAIRKKVISELEENAKTNAEIIVDQEMKEMESEHAIAISRLQDENNRKLMNYRKELTTSLFDEVTAKLDSFSKTSEYGELMVKKIKAQSGKHQGHAVITVALKDEKLLPELLKNYEGDVEGKVDPTIELGGFSIMFEQEGIVIDETFDSTLKDEKEKFYSKSNLIIR
ncbi:MAG: V-type ATP synthase subunit E family protein [Clostridiaceae bacterium]